MQILNVLELGGPNRWADVPVLEVLLVSPAFTPPTFFDRLRTALDDCRASFPPTSQLALQTPASSHSVADVERWCCASGSPASAFHMLAQMLQLWVGVDVGFATLHPLATPGEYLSIMQLEEASLAKACAVAAQHLCRAALADQVPAVEQELRPLIDLADSVRLGPSTRAIVRAATARGIPTRRLNQGSLVQLGEGRFQKRIWTAETSSTSEIGVCIAQNKQLTRRLLTAVGVPVPQGRQVADAEDAWHVASAIGLPVVVKPCDANHSRGVSLNLSTREEVLAAYEFAVRDGETQNVLVEHFAHGDQHRLLVVGDQLIAAARGECEYVVGDGTRTITELVAEINQDPRRGENYTDLLSPLKLDESACLQLQKQGLTPASIPSAGQRVLVQRIGDLTTDCTDEVHPAVAAAAILAARTVGLDIAGIDLIAQDISRPLEAQGGAIVEVNAGPSLAMHIAPLHGSPRPVGEAIVGSMFAAGENGRIPLVGVAGGGPRASIAQRIGRLWQQTTTSVGIGAPADELVPDEDGFSTVERLVLHPHHTAAVFVLVPQRAVTRGLEYPRCDVLVATGGCNCGENERLAIDIALRAVPCSGTFVLDTELPDAAELAARHVGKTIGYSLAANAARAAALPNVPFVSVVDGQLLLSDTAGETRIPVPASWLESPSEEWLPAIAACWALAGSAAEVAAWLALLPEASSPATVAQPSLAVS